MSTELPKMKDFRKAYGAALGVHFDGVCGTGKLGPDGAAYVIIAVDEQALSALWPIFTGQEINPAGIQRISFFRQEDVTKNV